MSLHCRMLCVWCGMEGVVDSVLGLVFTGVVAVSGGDLCDWKWMVDLKFVW